MIVQAFAQPSTGIHSHQPPQCSGKRPTKWPTAWKSSYSFEHRRYFVQTSSLDMLPKYFDVIKGKKVKKLIFGFVSLDIIPLDSHFRKARQAGEIKELMEIDEGMLQWGLRAAAMRLPFLPTRVGFGTDV